MLKKVLKKFISFILIFAIFISPCIHVFADNNIDIINIDGNDYEVSEDDDKIIIIQTLDEQITKAVYNKSAHCLVIKSFYNGRLVFEGKANLSSFSIKGKEDLIDFLTNGDVISRLDCWSLYF